jgi:hypothetical protein
MHVCVLSVEPMATHAWQVPNTEIHSQPLS